MYNKTAFQRKQIIEYITTLRLHNVPKIAVKTSVKLCRFLLSPSIILSRLGRYWIQDQINSIKVNYLFSYPEVINLNANDICNSACTMCNVWKQKKKFEFSPDQLENILHDPLFKKVKHIGITGGEPTLRKDLAKLYASIIKALPRIEGLSIITNCIRQDEVIKRVSESAAVCKQNNIPFSMMVSLDGVGIVHDQIRGTSGNFANVIKVIDYFKSNTDIPISIGATISKENAWHIDNLLFFMRQNNLYGRFRIAEFINRLYNEDRGAVIRNFDEDELYHLALFFKKLELSFETNETYKRTYRSIHNMLLGGKRLISCPYKFKGIVLNSKADISYCAPKSKTLGSLFNASGKKIYTTNRDEKKRILSNECDNCIHDYHAPITASEYLNELKEKTWKKVYSLNNPHLHAISLKLFAQKKLSEQSLPHVLITGWYGTETVGDKAILGGIYNFYKHSLGEFKITVASLNPFVTIRTLQELNIDGEVIAARSRRFFHLSSSADYIIMGGGPLMDIEELSVPLLAFKAAKRGKKIVFGCGIGPLTFPKYSDATTQILKLAHEVWVRDEASLNLARIMSNRSDAHLKCIGDPAKSYIEYIAPTITFNPTNELSCFLREWTHEYARHLTPQEFEQKRIAFEKGLSIFIRQTADELGVENIRFYHMHNFVVGNDDRDFSRQFISNYFREDERVSFDEKLSTVNSIVTAMLSARKCICMRFHSVLFASTLGADYAAIDYTLGGKIYNYLKDNNELSRLVNINDVSVTS